MSQAGVDFYLLESPSDAAVDRLACRVVEKAYAAGHRVCLLARDPGHGELLDDLLWTFSQGSFVPHSPAGEDDDAPVHIHAGAPPPDAGCDVLVTMLDDPLAQAFHHLRIADIIGAGDDRRRQARRRFRYYREHGMEPRTHRI